MSKTLSLSFALATLNGSIDRAASLAAAEKALDSHIAEHETEQSVIADAVSAVFTQYPGAALTMPTIEGMVLRQLNAQPSNYKALGKRVLDYVRSNSEEVRKDSAPSGTKLFGTKKGLNGGVVRWADQKPGAAADESTDSE